MFDGQEGQQGDALPQGGSTGYGAVRTIEEDAAEQPKCEHRKGLRGMTQARQRRNASILVYPS